MPNGLEGGLKEAVQGTQIDPSLTLRSRFPWPAAAILSKPLEEAPPQDGTDPRRDYR